MNIELISPQTLLCCLAFFFAGIVDSITGGGGLITIPAMLAAGIPVRFITGTNQCSAWIGSGVAAFKYMRSGNIHLKSALITLPFAVAGSYLGARLNLIVPVQYLKIFMLVTVPVIAIFLFANKNLGEGDHIDEKSGASIAFRSAAIGLLLGGYQGFYGPGAGSRIVFHACLCSFSEAESGEGHWKYKICHCSGFDYFGVNLRLIRRSNLDPCDRFDRIQYCGILSGSGSCDKKRGRNHPSHYDLRSGTAAGKTCF